ncbi:AbrB family transcriptional regulator [Paenibacillus turpanensis]|uniref:AbrB family transcriptional regulator n=1 Tax=Paenibacillus turpanensis TaxID=2689078 RepID=UPI00140DC7EA|nr:AbrB family transcriptional regulator [Paenibacillus turpanensis]
MNNPFKFIATLAAAAAGGGLFTLLNIPLSWMLGSLTGAAVWNFASRKGYEFDPLSRLAILIVGYALGRSFTAETLAAMAGDLPLMAAVTALVMVFSIGSGLLLAKACRIHPYSGVIGSIPGGLSQMVLLSSELKESNTAEVALLQTIRLISVVFLVPFMVMHGWIGSAAPEGGALAGTAAAGAASVSTPAASAAALSASADGAAGVAVPSAGAGEAAAAAASLPAWTLALALLGCIGAAMLAKRLRLPTPSFMGPVLAAAVVAASGVPLPPVPGGLTMAAQLALGIHIAMRIQPEHLANWRKLTPWALGSSAALLAVSLLTAWLVSVASHSDLMSAFLGTAPGGLTEMGVTAISVGADLPLVTSFQTFRLFFILLVIPPLLRWVLPRLPGVHRADNPRETQEEKSI